MRDLENGNARKRPDPNNVIITVLVESPSKTSINRRTDPISKAKMNPKAKVSKKKPSPVSSRETNQGNNRRAELLAYARELREVGNEQDHSCPRKNSRPKSKKWKWVSIVPLRIRRLSFLGVFQKRSRKWSYERINVDNKPCMKKKCHPGTNYYSGFCKKLKSFVKELSCGSKCYKE